MNINTITAATRIQAVATAAPRESTTGPASPAEPKARRGHDDTKPAPTPAKAPVHDLPEFKDYTLSFRYENDLNRIIVNVIDPETKEVVRSFPPEELIRALKQAAELHGILIDEQV